MKKTHYFTASSSVTDPQGAANKAMQLRDAFMKDNAAAIAHVEHESISVIAAGSNFNMLVATISFCYSSR